MVSRCFHCGKKRHYADKCPNPPNKLKNKINSLNIDEEEMNDLFRILQSQDYSNSDSSYIDGVTSDDSCYHSASESSDKNVFKISCNKSYCESKFCNVTSKKEEQENLLITLISKIENDELKDEYLKKLKKTMKHEIGKSVKTKISLDETLERFSKQKSKVVTISRLQHEISNIKKDIVDLKNDIHHIKIDNQDLKSQLLITNLHKHFQMDNKDLKIEEITGNQHEHSNDPESSNATVYSSSTLKFVKLVKSFIPPKWYAKITVIVAKDYSFDAIALIDSRSDMNCIQEGLVPSKYFEKSTERLNFANGDSLHINYELSKAYVCQNDVCFPTPSMLVKNMKSDKVILGNLFLYLLYPISSINESGITTVKMGTEVKFTFASKLDIELDRLNLVSAKTKHLNSLKQELEYKRIVQQLSNKLLQSKIVAFNNKLIDTVCSDLPNAFWHRKKHIVALPYIKDFSERKIPTKARPIQMNAKTLEFCQKEIADLLVKNIICKSKSLCSCAAFYIMKNAKLERGYPRLVINYKPLNDVSEWIRYPIPNQPS
jgi:hypothetical protein